MANQQVNANQAPESNAAPAKPANGTLTVEQLQAMVAELTRQNAALTAASNGAITFKCYAPGEKYTDGGGVAREGKGVMSMYGLGRMPVSLYQSQWRRMIEAVKSGAVEAALERFKGKLASKS